MKMVWGRFQGKGCDGRAATTLTKRETSDHRRNDPQKASHRKVNEHRKGLPKLNEQDTTNTEAYRRERYLALFF